VLQTTPKACATIVALPMSTPRARRTLPMSMALVPVRDHDCQSLSDRRLQPEFDLTGQLATVHMGGHGAESKHASQACNPARLRAR